MNPKVEHIVESVRGGQVEAYALVVRAYQQQVWRIVAYALRDISGTEDLVQQVFVQAYMKLDSYRSGRDFGAWIRTIARNLVREELRRRGREERRLRVYGEQLAARLEESGAAERRDEQLRQALAECREQLAPSAARAVEMRYERSMSFDEVARALDRTVAAARQMLARIRLSLRRCIEKKGVPA
ncbi:MAG: RNA polymerase sigma factor [Planctomycetota bacterium]|jgi:RNA polymerase sigma-70 factor (ECF subfamily)